MKRYLHIFLLALFGLLLSACTVPPPTATGTFTGTATPRQPGRTAAPTSTATDTPPSLAPTQPLPSSTPTPTITNTIIYSAPSWSDDSKWLAYANSLQEVWLHNQAGETWHTRVAFTVPPAFDAQSPIWSSEGYSFLIAWGNLWQFSPYDMDDPELIQSGNTEDGGVWGASWSPNDQVAYVYQHEGWIYDYRGTRRVTDIQSVRLPGKEGDIELFGTPVWSPDGADLYFSVSYRHHEPDRYAGILHVNLATGEQNLLAERPSIQGFSLDGRNPVEFFGFGFPGSPADYVLGDWDSEQKINLTHSNPMCDPLVEVEESPTCYDDDIWRSVDHFSWALSGNYLYSLSTFQPQTTSQTLGFIVRASPEQIIADHRGNDQAWYISPTWLNDGRYAYIETAPSLVWDKNFAVRQVWIEETPVMSLSLVTHDAGVAWAPDGSALAVTLMDAANQHKHVEIIPLIMPPSLSDQLAEKALTLVETQPDLAALLAIEAVRRQPGGSRAMALEQALIRLLPAEDWHLRISIPYLDTISWNSNGQRWLLSGDIDDLRQNLLWDVGVGVKPFGLLEDYVASSGRLVADGQLLMFTKYDGSVCFLNADTFVEQYCLSDPAKPIFWNISPNTQQLLTLDGDGNFCQLDLITGKQWGCFNKLPIGRVDFSPTGNLLLYHNDVLKTATGETLIEDIPDFFDIPGLFYALSYDDRWIASVPAEQLRSNTLTQTVVLRDTTNGTVIARLNHTVAPYETIARIAFSPDGQWLATSSGDWEIDGQHAWLWRMDTHQLIAQLNHAGPVVDLTFSPDSQWLVTSSYDNKSCVWETATGKLIVCMLNELNALSSKFSNDGRYLAVLSGWGDGGQNTVRIWDTTTWEKIVQLPYNGSFYIENIQFSPDGQWLIANGAYQWMWRWHPDDQIASACERLSRNLTPHEWHQYIGAEPYHKTCPALP